MHLTSSFGVITGAGQGTLVVDDVLGRLGPNVTIGVESRAPRPARQLMKLPGPQHPDTGAVKLGERTE